MALAARFSSDKLALHAGLLAGPLSLAAFQFFVKFALDSGISHLVFCIYRNALAIAVMGPLAFFLEKSKRTALSPRLIILLVLVGFLGIFLNQLLFLEGLGYTSPTIAAVITDSSPAFTFGLSMIFRLEEVNWKRRDGLAKVSGTILSVSGALIISFYKGPPVLSLAASKSEDLEPTDFSLLRRLASISLPYSAGTLLSSVATWKIGTISLLVTCLTWSSSIILQAAVLKKFSAPLSISAFASFIGTIMFLLVAAIREKEPMKWVPTSGLQITAFTYAGIIVSGFGHALQAWCIEKGGPILFGAFKPIEAFMVVLLSFIFFKESVHIGSLIGGVVIIAGLYLVTWGQMEQKRLALSIMEVTPP